MQKADQDGHPCPPSFPNSLSMEEPEQQPSPRRSCLLQARPSLGLQPPRWVGSLAVNITTWPQKEQRVECHPDVCFRCFSATCSRTCPCLNGCFYSWTPFFFQPALQTLIWTVEIKRCVWSISGRCVLAHLTVMGSWWRGPVCCSRGGGGGPSPGRPPLQPWSRLVRLPAPPAPRCRSWGPAPGPRLHAGIPGTQTDRLCNEHFVRKSFSPFFLRA